MWKLAGLAALVAALLSAPADAAVRVPPVLAPQLGFAALAAPGGSLRSFARADESYADPTGDAGAAPDISRVHVASVGMRLEFRVEYANRPCVGMGETLYLPINADLNASTGWNAPGEGIEYLVEVVGTTSRVTLYRWDGGDDWRTETRSVRGDTCTGTLPADSFGFERSEIAAGAELMFYAGTTVGDAREYADVAPDGDALYRYVAPPEPAPAEAPVATFAVSPGPHRIGDRITFTADAAGYESYLWDFGDGGGATGRVVEHVFREPGAKTISLHAAHHGTAADVQRTIAVRGPLTADELPTIAGPSARSRKDSEYSRAATRLARGPRSVFCWNSHDWPLLLDGRATFARGFVEVRARRQVHLAPAVCRSLDLLRYAPSRPQPTRGVGISLLILTHEVMHTVGVYDEALATCYGLQLMAGMGRDLGVGPAYADRLAELVWAWYSPKKLARGYWSARCRNGSSWDLAPNDDAWP